MILSIKSIVIALFLIVTPFAQDGNSLLSEVQKKYENIKDFSADFKQITGAGQVSMGTFYYKSKDKFKVDLGDRILISDGETIWNYTERSNKVVISPVEENGTSFSMDDYIYSYPENCTISYEMDNGEDVIVLKPNNASVDFKEVNLWVSKNRVINEIQLIDLMNNKFTVELTNIKLNQNLSEEFFTYTPKQGTQIIDLR